jgi:hypothetical protein
MRLPGFLLLTTLLGPPSLASGGEEEEEHPLPASVTVQREEAERRWREWDGVRHGTGPQLQKSAAGQLTRFRQIHVVGGGVTGPRRGQLVLLEWVPRSPGLFDEKWYAQSGEVLSERGVRPHRRHPFQLVFSEPSLYARTYHPGGTPRSSESLQGATEPTRYQAWLEDGAPFGGFTRRGERQQVHITHPGAKQELTACAKGARYTLQGPSGRYGLHEKVRLWDRRVSVGCTARLGTSVLVEYDLDGRLRLREHLTTTRQEGEAQVQLSVERWDREGRLRAEVRVERGALTGKGRCFHADGALAAEGQVRLVPGERATYASTGAWTTWGADGGVLLSLEDIERESPHTEWACLRGVE